MQFGATMQYESWNSAGRCQAHLGLDTPGEGLQGHDAVDGWLSDGNKQQREWWPSAPMGLASVNKVAPSRPSLHSSLTVGTTKEPSDDGGGDEDELAELLNTAMSKNSSSETEHDDNASNPLGISKTETLDNTLLNSLLIPLDDPPKCVAGSNLVSHARGFGLERVNESQCMTVRHKDAQDCEVRYIPLVSKRVLCHTPDVVVSQNGSSTLATITPVAHIASCSGLNMPGKQQQSPIVSHGSPFGMQSGGGLSMFGASVVASPQAAWSAEAASVLYVAVFLTPESRDVLLGMVPPVHPLVSADHMTLVYKPSALDLLDYPLGATVHLNIIGSAADSRAQAVAADPPTWLPSTSLVCSHVTISVAVGAKPVEAGQLIMDALQLAAVTDPSGPKLSGAGVYTHFSEPLPLVGTVGVKLALPSGEQVVYSIEELSARGWLRIGSDFMDSYYDKHASVLGKKERCRPVSSLGLHANNSGSSGSCSSVKPVALPPLQLPPPLLLPVGVAAAAAAAVTQDGDKQLELCATAGGAEHVVRSSPTVSDDDTASTGSSGSEAVQFRSAVHAGDYVAVRPFVPIATGDRILKGFVREFACEDAFQGNGVLVVLTDNTIGHVMAVLDPVSSQAAAATTSLNNKEKRGKNKSKAKGTSGKGGMLLAVNASDAADGLSEWALASRDGAASLSGLSKRTAEVAQRDLQLWSEFDALQQQHGEALCTAILQDCDQDFLAAIATIRAQFAGFAASSGTAAAPQVELEPIHSPTAATAADAVEADDLAQQLALSLGLSAENAVQLCKLVPHVPAERAVEVLQQQGGDVNKAADVLLSADAAGLVASRHAGSTATANRNATDRAIAAMVNGKDATIVASAYTLCAMFPEVQRDMAELLLKEHGTLDEAARALSDMQAEELEARTAAVAGSPLLPQLHTQYCIDKQHEQQQQPSEQDQLAMLAAMGLLNMNEAESAVADAEPLAAPFAKPTATRNQTLCHTPACSRTPSKNPPTPAAQMQCPTPAADALHASSYPAAQQQRGCVSPQRRGHHTQHATAHHMDRGAKQAAKAEIDVLYSRAKALQTAADVYMAAAQSSLKEGDMEKYQKQKALAAKARADANAAVAAANSKSWSANNSTPQNWQIDFHGLTVPEALRKFVTNFELLAAMDNPGGVLYNVIVGQGHHSMNNEPRIKKGVQQYLEEKASQVLQDTGKPWGVRWQVDPSNAGVINVHIPGSSKEEP